MSNSASSPIKDKATEWWQLISGEDTAKVYQEFFKRTWTILKETALLLWLLLCGVLVSVDWIWNSSSRVTESVSDLAKANKDSNTNTMSEAGTKLWTGIQKGASSSVAKAREQLKMPERTPRQKKTAQEQASSSSEDEPSEQETHEQAANSQGTQQQPDGFSGASQQAAAQQQAAESVEEPETEEQDTQAARSETEAAQQKANETYQRAKEAQQKAQGALDQFNAALQSRADESGANFFKEAQQKAKDAYDVYFAEAGQIIDKAEQTANAALASLTQGNFEEAQGQFEAAQGQFGEAQGQFGEAEKEFEEAQGQLEDAYS